MTVEVSADQPAATLAIEPQVASTCRHPRAHERMLAFLFLAHLSLLDLLLALLLLGRSLAALLDRGRLQIRSLLRPLVVHCRRAGRGERP